MTDDADGTKPNRHQPHRGQRRHHRHQPDHGHHDPHEPDGPDESPPEPREPDGPDDGLDDGPGGSPREPQPQPELSGEAQQRLQAARLWIAANRPYYSKAVFSCPVIAADPPTTVSIDKRWSIHANSQFLESVTVKRAAAELIHVINHALRDHASRARNTNVNAATAAIWNAAADCEINDDLFEDDLYDDDDYDEPGGWLLPDHFDMDDFLTAERYYRHLIDNSVAVPAGVECGSGCHSHGPDIEYDIETLSDFDRALLKRAVAAAVADHQQTCGAGSVPEGLARWAEQTLQPRVDWRRKLAAVLRSATHHKTGAADYTWQRLSRRQQPENPVLSPAMTRPVPTIAVVVDTSGSMSSGELDRALTEINAIISAVVPGDHIRVLSTDTDVKADQQVHNTTQIQLRGAGGTNMTAGICAAAETNPDAIVVITDGWTPWPSTRPAGARNVTAAITDSRSIDRVPDWIQTININDHSDT